MQSTRSYFDDCPLEIIKIIAEHVETDEIVNDESLHDIIGSGRSEKRRRSSCVDFQCLRLTCSAFAKLVQVKGDAFYVALGQFTGFRVTMTFVEQREKRLIVQRMIRQQPKINKLHDDLLEF